MAKPLTVALITPFDYQPFKSVRQLCDLVAQELAAAGVEVVSLTPSGFFSELTQPFPAVHRMVSSFERLTLSPMLLRAKLLGLEKKARAQKRDFVVLFSDQSLGIMGRALGGFRLATFVSDLIAPRAAFGEFGQPSTFGARFNQRATLSGLSVSSSFITPSQSTANDLAAAMPFASSRTTLAPLPLAFAYSPIIPVDLAIRLNQVWRSQGTLPPSYILYIGSAAWYKNRLGLIRLCGELKKINPTAPALVFAGERPTTEEKDLLQSSRVRFYHFDNLPAYDMQSLICGAECLVMPSYVEGFGWPALEALACGTPLVISDTSALAEHFASVAAIILPAPVKDNMEGWAVQSAEAVQVLLSLDSGEKQTIITNGLAHAATFTKEKFREGLIRGLALCE